MCSTRVAKVSNSCCWGLTGIPGATVDATVLRSSCLGDGSSVAGLLLDLLFATVGQKTVPMFGCFGKSGL